MSKAKACLNQQDGGEGGERGCYVSALKAHYGKGGGTGQISGTPRNAGRVKDKAGMRTSQPKAATQMFEQQVSGIA